jgi:phytanoyl-CoA hydroxylase
MMLTEAQVQEFRERGFLRGPRVYSDAEADALAEHMMEVMAGRSAGAPELNRNLLGEAEQVVTQIVNIWQADALFRQHIYHPPICEMAAQLIGHPVIRVWHDQIQYKPPHTGGHTGWHQDHPAWPIIEPADLISAWVALADATIENGCMWMVERSHLWGPQRLGTAGKEPESFSPQTEGVQIPEGEQIITVPCEVPKGHVMFHHCLTWHGSPINRSGRGRPAIAVHYMPGYTRYEPSARSHPMEHRVTVKPGEILQGEYFPTVWDHGPVAPLECQMPNV